MKYADCPTIEAGVVIAGSVDAVWELASDISLPTRFSNEVQSVEWVPGTTGAAVGAQFVGTNQHQAIGEWKAQCTVTAVEAKQRFEWTVGDLDQPSAIWRFTVAGSDGDVALQQWFQMGPGRSGLNYAIDAMPDKEERIVARRLEEHRISMQANLDGVKALIETGIV